MQSAFRNLRMKPGQFCLLVMKATCPIDGQVYYFVDKCLPFGASISCAHFQKFSDSIAHITQYKTGKVPVNYLDDFFFVAYLRALCDAQVRKFIEICNMIKFPVSLEKTYWSSETLCFLGLLIDAIHQFVSIPVDKVKRATDMIQEILGKRNKKITVKQIQKLCGFLNFICQCIVPGRAFTRRLYSYFSSSMKAYHHIRVSAEMRMDLHIWENFLAEPTVYCRPFLDYSHVFTAVDLDFYTDASGVIEYGGYYQSNWFRNVWSEEFLSKKPSIEYLELYAVTVGCVLWLKNFANKRVRIFCDNESVCFMVRDSSSKCKNCMILIRIIVLECLAWNVRLFTKHVPTDKNIFADALSRGQMKRFWTEASRKQKYFSRKPEQIPKAIFPPEKLWVNK